MFGFSLPKLLFTAIVIAAVWYGFKWFARQQSGAVGRDAKKPVNGGASGNKGGDTADTEQCGVCGAYVVSGATTNCGKDGCPFPG